MQNIKIIIGANYGDEGKGLATDFFGAQAQSKYGTVNVLTNGGPQRGHTSELPDGRRHVFKHFGAASFRGAASYYAEQFLVNPMEFVREYGKLSAMHCAPETYMHPCCRFSTPGDMLTNQLLLEKKGVHNSCGFGIWESVLRYQRGSGIAISVFAAMSREDRLHYLRGLRDHYFAKRLRELGISGIDAGLEDLFFRDELLFRFEEDCEAMLLLSPFRREEHLRHYQTVLFENAQGLLLDGNSPVGQEFTTPSTTGSGRVFQAVEGLFRGADVEVCYVTRSYLTRHGDGPMSAAAGSEISGARLGLELPAVRSDRTNVENRFQGILRYGMMDVDSLADRIREDFGRCTGSAVNHWRLSVMVTHLNEYAGIDTDLLARQFGTLYLSDGKTCSDVCRETAAIAV